VTLLETSVVKHFGNAVQFERELEVYRSGLPMLPRLLSFHRPFSITLERLEGRPYLDLLSLETVPLLAETIALFHRSTYAEGTCICHHDNQPRNILLTGKRFYLIDFSETRRDPPESDLTHLLLFWAEEFDPPAFELLCRSFLTLYLDRLPVEFHRWQRCLGASILRFDLRRALYRGPASRTFSPRVQQNRSLLRSCPIALIKR